MGNNTQDNASLIFPSIQTLPKVLGEPRLREDILNQLYQDATAYADFQKLLPQDHCTQSDSTSSCLPF